MNANEPNYARTNTVCLMVLAAVAATFSIYWLRPVLLPLVVALFVVSGVSPILNWLEKSLGVNRLVAAAMTFLSGVVILLVFGLSIYVSFVDLDNNSRAYRGRVQEIVERTEDRFESFVDRLQAQAASILPSGRTIELEGDASVDESDSDVESSAQDTVESPQTAPGPSTPNSEDAGKFVDAFLRDGITNISQAMLSLVSTSIVVLIYVFFLLIGTPSSISTESPTVREIDHQIRSYLALKTIISIFTGLAFGVALALFGVPMAFTFGVLAFLLNFIPNIGPLVASLLPIPLIILAPDGSVGWMIAAIAVTGMIQAISGNLVEPKIMGNSSDLHPVTILVALMFWGMMWGIIGMFLATPVTAAMKIVFERIDATRPFADLMAGRLPESGFSQSVV